MATKVRDPKTFQQNIKQSTRKFLDIEDPTTPHYKTFRKDEQTGLTTLQEQSNKQTSPTKRRGKPMGKRTGGRPYDKPRGMNLSSLEKNTKIQTPTKETTVHRDTESNKCSNSEAAEPTPQKGQPKDNTASNNLNFSEHGTNETLHSTTSLNLGKSFLGPHPNKYHRRINHTGENQH